jgi:hypothetical protein
MLGLLVKNIMQHIVLPNGHLRKPNTDAGDVKLLV